MPNNLLLSILIATILFSTRFLYEVRWRKYGRARSAKGNVQTALIPDIHNERALLQYLQDRYATIQKIEFLISEPRTAGSFIFSKNFASGTGYICVDKSRQQLYLGYLWYKSGAIIDSWQIQDSTLNILSDPKTGRKTRLTIVAVLKRSPLSIECNKNPEFETLETWLTSLPFKRITHRKELF